MKKIAPETFSGPDPVELYCEELALLADANKANLISFHTGLPITVICDWPATMIDKLAILFEVKHEQEMKDNGKRRT